jgi:hypothetical protein
MMALTMMGLTKKMATASDNRWSFTKLTRSSLSVGKVRAEFRRQTYYLLTNSE